MITSTADAGGLVARAAGGSSLNGGEKLIGTDRHGHVLQVTKTLFFNNFRRVW
jgi:hypothetical protein